MGPVWNSTIAERGLTKGSSRLTTKTQREEEKPLPSREHLDRLPLSWAVKILVELAERLHRHAEIPTPAWLVEP